MFSVSEKEYQDLLDSAEAIKKLDPSSDFEVVVDELLQQLRNKKAASDHAGKNTVTKARYWWAVLWLENMKDGWQDNIDEILQGIPYAYCIHDKDYEKDGDPQLPRKQHVHLMIAYGNTTTYKHAMNIFSRFSAEGKSCVNTCEACLKVRHSYNYLIHDTNTCEKIRLREAAEGRKFSKFLYPVKERVTGNNFDIGLYEQLSVEDRHNYIKRMDKLLIDSKIYDYSVAAEVFAADDDPVVFDTFLGHSSHFERMCKGIYLRECRAGSPPPISVQLVTKKRKPGSSYVAE